MKALISLLAFVLTLAADSVPETRIQYFSHVRQVQITKPGQQNYAILDDVIWKYARPDLGDLRLYAGNREVPYALSVQRRSQEAKPLEARILNIGRVNGATQLDLDLSAASEYDEVTLSLSAKDFVTRARVEGLDRLEQRQGVDLGTSTLFDFSREKLGGNASLRFVRPATFRYLRITMQKIEPEQVLRAIVVDTREGLSAWTPAAVSPRIEQSGRATVITWDFAEQVPLARVLFAVDPSLANFRRSVEIQNADGRVIAAGEISRIHLIREGKPVDSEALAVEFPDTRSARYRAVIQNGDDAPLPLSGMTAFALERRIYFDPKSTTSLSLYVGDPKLTAPIYDYAKSFRPEDDAAPARLGPVSRNGAYTGRPDERPWTERHPAVLWTTLVLAVVGLGALALKGMKGA